MARQKLSTGATKSVSFKLGEADLKRTRRYAAREKMSLAEYIRDSVLRTNIVIEVLAAEKRK